jgi:hypothetical protein
MDASEAVEAKADELVANVFSIVDKATASLGWLAEDYQLAALRHIRDDLDDWAGRWRVAARTGVKPDGSGVYSYAKWSAYGVERAKDAADQAGYAAESGGLYVLQQTITASAMEIGDAARVGAQNVKAIVNVGAWGASTKVVVSLLLAAVVVFKVARLFGR